MQWQLTHHGYNPDLCTALGNRFLTANGYLGVRGALEEHQKTQLAAINLAGIYDQVGGGWREPLNAPNPFFVTHACGHVPVTSHMQGLDIRRGLQYRKSLYGDTKITAERFCSMADVHVLALHYTASSGEAAWHIDTDVWDIHGPHYVSIKPQYFKDGMSVLATAGNGKAVAVAARILPKGKTAVRFDNGVFYLSGGEEADFAVVAAIYTSNDDEDPLALASKALERACLKGYKSLKSAHEAVWQSLWENTYIEIDGDEEAETALNYSLYHLLSIAPRHRDDLSIAARGLSGQTYKGAVFWDTEMFILNFLMGALPQSAASTLRYRIRTLNGAREKARVYGCRGAFYAWESQEGGFDACSDYNVTDVFTGRPMRTYFKDKQIHISAAVVYGLWSYFERTGDLSLLLEGGAEVILECARFYHSLLVKHVEKDDYELWDVIGPDEYHERVNNNAYTNEMARFTFETAVKAAGLLKAHAPESYERLGFENELQDFHLASLLLKAQKPDERGVIEQFDGYFDLEDASLEAVRSRLLNEKEYWGGAYGVASHTQVIKQADVITMLYLFKDRYSKDILRANYDYYEPRTEHGSSLSACMYALTACLTGRPDAAYPLFMKSAKADLVAGGKEWAGLVYIGGTHPAAAGGAYMTLLNGFLGFSSTEKGFKLAPCLPSHWQGVRMRLLFQGKPYRLAVQEDSWEISPV